MDLTEWFNEADVERKRDTNKEKSKTEYELAQAQEIRQTSLESDTEIIGHTCLKRQKKTGGTKKTKQELDVQERQSSQAREARQAQIALMQQQNNAMLELKQEEERTIESNKKTCCDIFNIHTCMLNIFIFP